MSNKIIKTVMIAVIAILSTSTVYAQEKGELGLGGGFSVATGDDYTNFGIGAKFRWNPIDNLRLEPSFNYFFKKDIRTFWDLSANIHYLFPVGDKVTIYPLAGLGIQDVKVHVSDYIEGFSNVSETQFAFNIGAGVDVDIAENWLLNFEFKYKVSDFDRAVFSLGLVYNF